MITHYEAGEVATREHHMVASKYIQDNQCLECPSYVFTTVATKFNLAYIWPAVSYTLFLKAYINSRCLAFWAKLSYVTSEVI